MLFQKKAKKFADSNGYTKDLATTTWKQLGNKLLQDPKKINKNGKRGLTLEHVILRSDIMNLLLKCDHTNSNKIKTIVSNTRCAVIHWEEDAELNIDYGRKRPDPKEAYAGIELIDYKDISGFIDLNWVYKNIKNKD